MSGVVEGVGVGEGVSEGEGVGVREGVGEGEGEDCSPGRSTRWNGCHSAAGASLRMK